MQSRITGAISLMLAQAVVLVLGYVTHLWIGRVLGPAPYGIYGIVLSLQSIFGLFLTLGVPVAIARYVAQDEQHAHSIIRQGIRLQIAIALILGTIILLTAPLQSRLLGDMSLMPYISFMAAVIVAQALYPIYVQYLSGMHRFNRQALLTSLYAIAKVIGALSLIYFIGVYGAFAGFAVGGLLAAVAGWWWTRDLGGHHPKKIPLRRFLSFAGTYVLILVGLQLLISLDLFMVKALLKDDTLAGFYNAAVTLSRISYMLLQALGFILLPSVAKLTKPGQSHHEAAVFISDAIRYLIALIIPSVALAAATSRPLITLFFSQEYIPAAPALTILMVGVGSLAFYFLLSNIVSGAGKPQISLLITSTLIILSVILGFILIPEYGLIGAALQTTITGLGGLGIMSLYTFRSFAIPIPTRSIINIITATIIAVAPTYLWQATPLTLVIQYLASGLIYLISLLILQEVTPTDRQRLASIHPRLAFLAPRSNS